jgi:hypothetical protein
VYTSEDLQHSNNLMHLYQSHAKKANGGDDSTQRVPVSAYCCFSSSLLWPCANQSKALVTSYGFLMVITTDIHTGRMAIMKGNTGKYADVKA